MSIINLNISLRKSSLSGKDVLTAPTQTAKRFHNPGRPGHAIGPRCLNLMSDTLMRWSLAWWSDWLWPMLEGGRDAANDHHAFIRLRMVYRLREKQPRGWCSINVWLHDHVWRICLGGWTDAEHHSWRYCLSNCRKLSIPSQEDWVILQRSCCLELRFE